VEIHEHIHPTDCQTALDTLISACSDELLIRCGQ
jgi:hypothetical protein